VKLRQDPIVIDVQMEEETWDCFLRELQWKSDRRSGRIWRNPSLFLGVCAEDVDMLDLVGWAIVERLQSCSLQIVNGCCV